jgi:hypothetical protein
MIEPGAPSTKELSNTVRGVVPAIPGANMVAPSEVPRNAEGAQSEGRAREGYPKSAAKDSIKAEAP